MRPAVGSMGRLEAVAGIRRLLGLPPEPRGAIWPASEHGSVAGRARRLGPPEL